MAGTGSSKLVDPIAYRAEEQQSDSPVTEKSTNWQFDAAKLQNADVNLSAYGDDSSETNYNNPELWGGENTKYKGENTKNTSVAYNPNATLEGLNPDYAYGQKAQMVNSGEAGYIQRRNDEIASALYNAGKTSIEDVANFLNNQTGFQNSTENERNNTIASVWKRLGEISSNGNGNENKEDTNSGVENNEAIENMETDLLKSTSGELYGKNTADVNGEDSAIKTLQDQYNVERAVNEQRIRNVKNLQSMSSESIAYMINEGVSTYGDQAMRDLMQYDPNKYQEIQNELKKIKGQNAIDQISMDGKIKITEQLEKDVDNANSEMSSFVNKTASERDVDSLTTSLSNVLSESEIVSSARGQMEVYKRKIEEIQSAADSLTAEANKKFKSDVPQYLVNAFISNRMQQYNKELQKYQNLYNASLDEAKFEISQAQWREEMDYKWKNMKADQDYKDANLKLQQAKFNYEKSAEDRTNQISLIKNGTWNKDGSYSYINEKGQLINISADNSNAEVSAIVGNNADAFFSVWQQKMDEASLNGEKCYGQQCEQFTDNYTNEFYGVKMEGDGHQRTTAEEKRSYVNTTTPSKGLVAVWNYTNGTDNMKKYGHTGIVMDVDRANGTFTYMASNNKGDEAVGIYKGNIYDANLQGFWNPTKPKGLNQTIANNGASGTYSYTVTPMSKAFQEAYDSAGDAASRAAILRAENLYDILYEIEENGTLEKLIQTNYINDFLGKLKTRTFGKEDDGVAFWEQFESYVKNNIADEDAAYAMDRLFRGIEAKMRAESGAAINSSEWKTQFERYFPQSGQSADLRRKKVQQLEKDAAVASLPPSELKWNYIPAVKTYSEKKSKKDEEIANMPD